MSDETEISEEHAEKMREIKEDIVDMDMQGTSLEESYAYILIL